MTPTKLKIKFLQDMPCFPAGTVVEWECKDGNTPSNINAIYNVDYLLIHGFAEVVQPDDDNILRKLRRILDVPEGASILEVAQDRMTELNAFGGVK